MKMRYENINRSQIMCIKHINNKDIRIKPKTRNVKDMKSVIPIKSTIRMKYNKYK